jgi:hypothetical protein
MRILNGRDWPVPPGKIPGLVRIAVLGDSMTYGQGVGPDETLPFVLENQLNEQAIESLFQVTNCGVSGFNIWNSLSSLQNLPPFYDAVVLILCSNDAEIFGRTSRIDYGFTGSAMWEPGTASFDLMRRALANTLAWLSERDVPLFVAYYGVWQSREETRNTQIIGEVCRSLNCPFVNFFDHFQARKLSLAAMRVSKFDFHPSSIVHSTAARYLLHQLQRVGWLERFKSSRQVGSLPTDLLAVAQEMDREGARLDAILRWGIDTLNMKIRAVARRPDSADGEKFSSSSKSVLEALNATYAEWRALARAQALAVYVFSNDSASSGALWQAEEAILHAEELMLAAGLPDEAAIASLKSRLPNSEEVPLHVDLSPARAKIQGCRIRTGRVHQMLEQALSGKGMTSFGALAALRRDAYSSLAELVELDALLGQQAAVWTRRADEAEKRALDATGEAKGLISRAKQSLEVAAGHLSRCYGSYDYLLDDVTTVPEFLTTVVIYVQMFKRPKEKPYMLDALVESLVPHRMLAKDGTNIGFDGSIMSVSMRFPIFFFGRVTIRLEETPRPGLQRRRGTFLKMEIYNDPSRRVTLNRDQFYHAHSGQLVFPFVLVS